MAYGAVFQPVVERLCEDFRIITIEPRGAGASDSFTRPYSLTQHMEDVRAVIEATGAAPVTVVGISRGGTLAILLAATYPALLNKMVLVDPAPPVPGTDGALPSETRFADLQEALREEDLERAISIFVPTVVSEPGTEAIATQTVERLCDLSKETILSFFLDREDDARVHELLDRVAAPTLVMHGTEDRRIPFEDGRYIAEHIPGAKLYPFQGRGHLPMTTAIGEFCEVLRLFVRTGTVPGDGSPAP